ncbi:MAG: hypothetical protein CME62_12305 [Halobacteriovoraceae bacterium]|nr:hypothetical protein [Halobacteriovoraceae bacterium]|tara:strand:- start:383 stop:1195 length:813 start_codon:yes stop_codon:yes gene_type:complete
MKNLIILIIAIVSVNSFANCDDLYERRGESLSTLKLGKQCLKDLIATSNLSKDLKGEAISDLSYLMFFEAEYYLDNDEDKMLAALNKAKEGAEIFGELNDFRVYRKLSQAEQAALAEALYNFGTITARYIDLKGKWEAIKRMGDIKKPMSSVIRLKQQEYAHYGAHRTLAIFYLKVPGIAGGSIEKSKEFFDVVMKQTTDATGLSSYPLNNMVYADYLFEVDKDKEACAQLAMVKNLTAADIAKLDNGFEFETGEQVKEAARRFAANKCQ